MKIVVLDDMLERHMWFALAYKGHEIVHLFSLKDLDVGNHIAGADFVFLDHDLNDEKWQIQKTGLSDRPIVIDAVRDSEWSYEKDPDGFDAVLAICVQTAQMDLALSRDIKLSTRFIVHSMSADENVSAMTRGLIAHGFKCHRYAFDLLPPSIDALKTVLEVNS